MMPLKSKQANSVRRARERQRAELQTLAAIGGAAICAPAFFYLGSMSDYARLGIESVGSYTVIGTGAGAVIGAILGWGLLRGLVGSMVVWIVGMAVFCAVVGPGCDADPVSSGLVGAGLGWFFGLTGWRGFLVLVGGAVGTSVGVSVNRSDQAGFIGMAMGALLGYCVGYLLFHAMCSSGRRDSRGA